MHLSPASPNPAPAVDLGPLPRARINHEAKMPPGFPQPRLPSARPVDFDPNAYEEAPMEQHASGLSGDVLHENHITTIQDWYWMTAHHLQNLLTAHRRYLGQTIAAQDFGNFRALEKAMCNVGTYGTPGHTLNHYRMMLLELLSIRAESIREGLIERTIRMPLTPVDQGIMKYRAELTRKMTREAYRIENQHEQDREEHARYRTEVKFELAMRQEKLRKQEEKAAKREADKAEKEARRAAHEAKRADNQRKRDEKEANKSLARASRHAAQSGESPSDDSARTREVQGTSRGLDAGNAATPAAGGQQDSGPANGVVQSSSSAQGSESGSAVSEASPLKLLSGPGSDAPLSLIAAS